MLNESNAIIHAGVLIGIALLIYHFFIRGDVAESFNTGSTPDNGLAGYPNIDSF